MSTKFDEIITASHVFCDDVGCFFDEYARLFVMIDRTGNILAALDYHIEQEAIARVQESASLQNKKGYGYTIYLYALATLSPNLMVCADSSELSPGALALWERIFNAATDTNHIANSAHNSLENCTYDGLIKRSLVDTPVYRQCIDEEFQESVFITNPDLFIQNFDAFDLSADVQAERLKPNLPNWGFSMYGKISDQISSRVFRKAFTPAQKRVIYDFLTCTYQLRHCRFTIAMQLPRSSQTTLAQ